MNYGLEENLISSTIGHLAVSVIYLGINGENLGKFDVKSDIGIFLGYLLRVNDTLRNENLMSHTIPNLSFKEFIRESRAIDLHPFNEVEEYSLEQFEVVVLRTWIKL